MRKLPILSAAVLVSFGALPTDDAEARSRNRGAVIAAGVAGLAVGALIGAAASNAYARPAYGYSYPAYGYPYGYAPTGYGYSYGYDYAPVTTNPAVQSYGHDYGYGYAPAPLYPYGYAPAGYGYYSAPVYRQYGW